MARRVVWTDQAIEDLDSIAAFIARDSGRYARVVVQRIWSASQELPEFPRSWRRVPELMTRKSEYRERIVMSWRLIYRVEQDAVRVVGVIHGKRHFAKLEDRFEEAAQAEYQVA